MPRRHHGCDRKIAEPHHAGDHLLFAGLQHAGIFGFDHQSADFLLADFFFRLAALTEQPQQALAGPVEQPHQRQRDLCQQHHRRRDLDRDRFGIAQRDLLRHQFADDQGCIGDDPDHDADADRFRKALRQSEFDQPGGQPLPQRRAGEGAGQHADQRDADLHGGEEFAGIGGQRQRAARAGDAFFDQRRQPRRPGRHDGQFRHREQAIDDDQDRDDPEFQIQHVAAFFSATGLRIDREFPASPDGRGL